MNDVLKKLRDNIAKASKGIYVSILSESDIAQINEYLTLPAYDLNRIISGDLAKGFPQRSLILIVGPEHSFKTSMICLAMAEAQKHGYKVIYIDTEGIKEDFLDRWGVDTNNCLHVYSPWIKDIFATLGQIKDSGDEKWFIAIDSIGGIERYKLAEDAIDGEVKADQGLLQKELKRVSKLCSNICKAQNSIIMASGHFYDKPSAYGNIEEIVGGKSWKHFSDILISLKKSKIKDKDKNVIGNEILAITLKNRYYPPFTEGVIEINYVGGLNQYAGMVDLAIKAGLLTRGGAWYTYRDDKKVQGTDAVYDLFKNDSEFIPEINTWLLKTHYSTVKVIQEEE
jgi:recombination protein RecA